MAKTIITTTANGSPVTEGNSAVITYHLSIPLSSATTVSASVTGVGATAGTDYGALYYHMGNDPLSTWKPVVGGVITLNSGFSDFQLKVDVVGPDSVVETWDTLTFVVAQTAQTIGIESSWYVASTVALLDQDAGLANATVTLASTSPHTATEAAETPPGTSNHAAYALYDVSLAGGLSVATSLKAAVYGEGATAGSDYGALYYRASTLATPAHATGGDWTTWTAVPTSGPTLGQIALGVGVRHFELSTSVPTDNVVETWESLTFTVGQTAASSHIENSWYVGSRVALLDAGSTLPNATITLASASPLTATEAAETPPGTSNHAAYARYDVSLAGGLSVDATLNAAVYGVGATAGLDYGALQYRALTDSTWSDWSSVSAGQISLTAGVKQFELSTSVLSDTIEETWESLIFAVSQTSASSHIENSWYVASNVALLDGDGALAVSATDNVSGVVNLANTNVAYTYTFNRAVTDLASDDFSVTNGSIGSITGSGTTYTVNVIPASGVTSGNISLVLRQGAVLDVDGNTNLASTEASQAIDTARPAAPGQALAEDTAPLGDGQTSNGRINVSGVETGATWQYSTNSGVDWSAAQAAAVTSFTLPLGTYASGAVQVRQTDAAGNLTAAPSSSAGQIVVTPVLQNIQLYDSLHSTLLGTFDTLKQAADAANIAAGTDFFIDVGAGSVSVGGSVNGSGGTNADQVVINKNITLAGAGMGLTTLLASIDTGTSGNARGMIVVNSGKAFNVRDLTLDGNSHLVFQAIRDFGSGTIARVHFDDIQYQASGPAYMGTALAVMGGYSVDVTNSVFTDIGRVGVNYYGAGSAGTFSGNTYTGKGAGDWLDYAVEVGGGGNATVTNNTVAENSGVASVDQSSSAGFLVSTYFGAGTTATLTGNTVTNSTTGVYVGYDNADSSGVIFGANNHFTTNVDYGVVISGDAVATGTSLVDGAFSWWGGDGTNLIVGAAGNDALTGGAGADTITTGLGTDTVNYQDFVAPAYVDPLTFAQEVANTGTVATGVIDIITDFVAGTDSIDFTVAGTGNFVVGAAVASVDYAAALAAANAIFTADTGTQDYSLQTYGSGAAWTAVLFIDSDGAAGGTADGAIQIGVVGAYNTEAAALAAITAAGIV